MGGGRGGVAGDDDRKAGVEGGHSGQAEIDPRPGSEQDEPIAVTGKTPKPELELWTASHLVLYRPHGVGWGGHPKTMSPPKSAALIGPGPGAARP